MLWCVLVRYVVTDFAHFLGFLKQVYLSIVDLLGSLIHRLMYELCELLVLLLVRANARVCKNYRILAIIRRSRIEAALE